MACRIVLYFYMATCGAENAIDANIEGSVAFVWPFGYLGHSKDHGGVIGLGRSMVSEAQGLTQEQTIIGTYCYLLSYGYSFAFDPRKSRVQLRQLLFRLFLVRLFFSFFGHF